MTNVFRYEIMSLYELFDFAINYTFCFFETCNLIKLSWLSGYVVRHVFTRYCVRNLSIIMHEMTLDKSPMVKLSRTTHSYRANISSVSTGAQILPSVKRKR